MNAATSFSNFVVYVDESGDHSLTKIDANYPVFVLNFCIFHKSEYADVICPALQRIKFKYFGHDALVFHEREIRKAVDEFAILQNPSVRADFMVDINELMKTLPMTLVAVVIRKHRLRDTYSDPANPYHLALEYGVERVCHELNARGQSGRTTHLIFESRGAKEDRDLELEFRRVLDRNSICGNHDLKMVMSDKRSNATGLQLADLMARPIGRFVMDETQPNRAFDLIKPKFRVGPYGFRGYGLKVFP